MSNLQHSVPLWQEIHARLFSTPSDRWWETYAIWTRLFHAEGWNDEQLVDAVYRIARRAVLPQFAPQHLQAIHEELVASANEVREIRRKHFEGVTCSTCDSTGWVMDLPHLDHVRDGRWHTDMGVYYTQAVCCSCAKGQAIKSAIAVRWQKEPIREGQFPMDLPEYIRRNSGYQSQVAARDEIRRTQRELDKMKNVSSSNENVQQKLQELMAKIGRRAK